MKEEQNENFWEQERLCHLPYCAQQKSSLASFNNSVREKEQKLFTY